jgi:undecaprenyl-diphosphatase
MSDQNGIRSDTMNDIRPDAMSQDMAHAKTGTPTIPRGTLISGIIVLLLFIVWTALVAAKSSVITAFDTTIGGLLHHGDPTLIHVASVTTQLGDPKVIVIASTALIVVLALCRKFAYAIFAAAVTFIANGSNWAIKHAIHRPRPIRRLAPAHGYSFPSGHSCATLALAGILIVLVLCLIRNQIAKTILVILLALFPLTIGCTRILLNVHFPSDVLGGWIEALAFVLLCYSAFDYFYLQRPKKVPLHKKSR